nr:hypothetical protein CFP56_19556 [Quercus suber]
MPAKHLDALPDRVSGIQRTPHMPQGLFVARIEAIDIARKPFEIATDIALAHRGIYDLDIQISGKRKEALQVHVHVLANRSRVSVPSTDMLNKSQRQRIDGSGNDDFGTGIQA